MSKPIVLADNLITRHDRFMVELFKPAGSPAFILLQWPAAASVVAADPAALAAVARALVSALARAQAKLAAS
jgi:hypothetical protein